jgi:pheromone shutdown protein TraB
LGDRPIEITLKRAINSLTFWQVFIMTWGLLVQRHITETITTEDMENLKKHDTLEKNMKELMEGLPNLGKVFITERDLYLCHFLQTAAQQVAKISEPCNIVGVMGIAHAKGIYFFKNNPKIK